MNILEELEWRGLVADCTDKEAMLARAGAGQRPLVVYCGFDPTADSLHVGNLVPLIALRRFQLCGHRPIALAGGATGLIGDPSGRTVERQLLSREALQGNIAKVKEQLRKLLDFSSPENRAMLLDNLDWTGSISFLDFLREFGKHFSVNMMISKESVRSRMEDREVGISYTEFSYMLLQALDFYHLRREHGCELQIGGSDQWGNITAGIDLCRKKLGVSALGLTLPLITNADGSKFGKSVAGAVWLDAGRTSVYRFYQFWVRTDDLDVIRFLKFFTFLEREEIGALEQRLGEKPEAREAHKRLAAEMTRLIHGESATREAVRASEILFGGGLEGISEEAFAEIAGEAPSHEIDRRRFESPGFPLVELLVLTGLSPSKGQARKDIEGGGIYLNNLRQSELQRTVQTGDLLFGRQLLLRKGKRNYLVVTAK
jgi:tyrosyl-tRNA synthetase